MGQPHRPSFASGSGAAGRFQKLSSVNFSEPSQSVVDLAAPKGQASARAPHIGKIDIAAAAAAAPPPESNRTGRGTFRRGKLSARRSFRADGTLVDEEGNVLIDRARIPALRKWMAGNAAFKELDGPTRDEVLLRSFLLKYELGRIVFMQGDPGDRMFVIISGSVYLCKRKEQSAEAALGAHALKEGAKPDPTAERVLPEGHEMLARLVAGEMFGESALLHGKPRSATVVCAEECEFLVVTRRTYDTVLKASLAEARQEKLVRLQACPLFAFWSRDALEKLLPFMWTAHCVKGHAMVEEGKATESAYVLQEGECEVSVRVPLRGESYADPRTGRRKLRQTFRPMPFAVLTAGDWFGDVEALTGSVPVSTVTVVSAKAVFLVTNAVDFRRIVQRNSDTRSLVERVGRQRRAVRDAALARISALAADVPVLLTAPPMLPMGALPEPAGDTADPLLGSRFRLRASSSAPALLPRPAGGLRALADTLHPVDYRRPRLPPPPPPFQRPRPAFAAEEAAPRPALAAEGGPREVKRPRELVSQDVARACVGRSPADRSLLRSLRPFHNASPAASNKAALMETAADRQRAAPFVRPSGDYWGASFVGRHERFADEVPNVPLRSTDSRLAPRRALTSTAVMETGTYLVVREGRAASNPWDDDDDDFDPNSFHHNPASLARPLRPSAKDSPATLARRRARRASRASIL